MPPFMMFVYWAYFMPTLFAIALGMLVVELGRLPDDEEYKRFFSNKLAEHSGVVITGMIPGLNFLYVLEYLVLLVRPPSQ